MHSIFGWDYPPGCNHVPGDEDRPCEVCGNDPYYCVCPECPECGEQGNPQCYSFHGLQLSAEQINEANYAIDQRFAESDPARQGFDDLIEMYPGECMGPGCAKTR